MTTHKLQIKPLRFKVDSEAVKKRIEKLGYSLSTKEIKSIWEEYIVNTKDKLISEGGAKLMCGLGSLNIYKIAVIDFKIRNKKLILNATNINRIGQHYFITLDNEKNIRFKPSGELSLKLKGLLKTDRDFKPAPLKYVNN